MMWCEVCDRTDTDTVLHGLSMHSKCAPKAWVKEAQAHGEFMRRFDGWWAGASGWQRAWDGHGANCGCTP